MAKITFYSTSGHQVDPKATNPSDPPSPIGGLIDHEIEFYVDYDRLFVASLIWAESSAAGNRKVDSFYVVYQGDSRSNLLENFNSTLDKIESGDISTDHTWGFPHDNEDRYELPWFTQSHLDSDLTDMGLTYAEQLATQELIEEGESMDVGVIDWKVAAIPAVFIASKTEGRCQLAVSRNGRQSVLSDVAVVIQPGKEANFLPLTDATASKFKQKKANLKDTITNQCEVIFEDRLDDLAAEPIEDREHDLLRIQEYFDGLHEIDLRTDKGRDILELIRKVSEGGIVADKYDTNTLTQEESQAVIDSLEATLQAEINQLEGSAIKSAYHDRLEEVVDKIKPEPLETRYTLIDKIRSIFAGQAVAGNNQIVAEVNAVFEDMQNSELLERSQQTDIENQLSTYARELHSSIERIRREDIESSFETAREEIEELSLERQKVVVGIIQDELDVVIGDTTATHKLPVKYKNATEHLENDAILDDDIKSNIWNNELKLIRELEDQIDTALYEQKSEELKNRIKSQQRLSDTSQEEIELLQGIQKLLKVPDAEITFPKEIHQTTKLKLDRFNDELKKLSDNEALSDVFYKICDELNDYCISEIDDIVESELEDLQREIIQNLKADLTGLNIAEKLDRISKEKSKLLQIDSRGRNAHTNIKPMKRALKDMGSPYDQKNTFERIDLNEFVDDTISEIEELEEEYQQEYRETLEQNFMQNLSTIVAADNLNSKEKLYIFRTLDAILSGNDKSSVDESDYDVSPERFEEKIDLSGVTNGANVVSPNFDSELAETHQSDLQEKFLEEINGHIDDICSDKTGELLFEIKKEINASRVPDKPYSEQSFDTLNTAITELKQLKEMGGSNKINYSFLNEKEWFDLLSQDQKEEVHSVLVEYIDGLIDDLVSAIGKISTGIYQNKLDEIKDLQDPLDTVVATKQFQNLLAGKRSQWPDPVNDKGVNPPQNMESGNQRDTLQQKVSKLLSTETTSLVEFETSDLDSTLFKWDDNDRLTFSSLEALAQKIEDPNHETENDPIPHKERIETIHSKLGKFGKQDETYKEVRNGLQDIVSEHKERLRDDGAGDDDIIQAFQNKLGSAVISTSVAKVKVSHLAIAAILIASVIAIAAGGGLGGFDIGFGEGPPSSTADGPVAANDTETELTSLSFVGTLSGNDTINYTMSYSLTNANPTPRTHQVAIAGVQNTSGTTVTAQDGDGATIQTVNMSSTTASGAQSVPDQLIEYVVATDDSQNLTRTQVSLEGQLSTTGLEDDIGQNTTVMIQRVNETALSESTSLQITNETAP